MSEWMTLNYVSKEHKSYELCLEAVKEYCCALQYVPEELKTYELCLMAMIGYYPVGKKKKLMMDKKLFLLGFDKYTNKLTFDNKINSLEFVELIGDMDLKCSVNYKKRNLYLIKIGQELFKNFKHRKEKKIRIEISHDIVYISGKANKLKLLLKKLFNLKIIVNINIMEFKNYSNTINYNIFNHKKPDVLSQEEIDELLTKI